MKNQPLDIGVDRKTIFQSAFLSDQVYKEKFADAGAWKVVDSYVDPNTGFQGAAYLNRVTNKVVVAFRGTDLSERNDLRANTNIAGFKGDIFDRQVGGARELIERVQKSYPNTGVSLTGHSLGGAIAQVVGSESGLETHTFNAPGVSHMVKNPSGMDHIYNHVRDSDIIGTAGDHVGHVVRYPKQVTSWVDADGVKMSETGNPIPGVGDFNQHSMPNLASDLADPNFQPISIKPAAPKVLRDEVLTNPLQITHVEGNSIKQRLDLGEGQHLGEPTLNGDGSYFYPIMKDGAHDGGFDIARNSEGSLDVKGTYKVNQIESSAGISHPQVEANLTGGKGKEYDLREGTEKDTTGFSGIEAKAGMEASASANAFGVKDFDFKVAPDGSASGRTIESNFGKLEGTASAGGVVGVDGKGKPDAHLGVDLGVEAKLAESTVEVEKSFKIDVNGDGKCEQTSISGEGGAFIGGAAGYSGGLRTDGAYSKATLGLGPGVTVAGKFEYEKEFDCKDNPFETAGETPSTSLGSGSGANIGGGGSQLVQRGGEKAEVNFLTPAEGGGTFSDGPTRGNWGGGGYSGGVRDDTPVCREDWQPPVDAMDAAMRDHDYAYMRHGIEADTPQSNPFKQQADLELLERLKNIPDSELDMESMFFKKSAQALFGYKVAREEVSQSVIDTYEKAKQQAVETWEATADAAGNAVDQVQSAAESMADTASEKMSEIGESIKEGWDGLTSPDDAGEDEVVTAGGGSWGGGGGSFSGAGASGSWAPTPGGGGAGVDSLVGGGGSDKSISVVAGEAESLAGDAESSAQRAESAASRAEAALSRAISAREALMAKIRGQ